MSTENSNSLDSNSAQSSPKSEQMMRTQTSSINGIAPLDIQTIKHIYQKAVLMSKLEEEAEKIDSDFETSNKVDNLSSLSDSAFDLTLESIAAGKLDSVPNGAANGFNTQQILCDKQDINLRSPTFVKIKEENNRLRLLLNVREEELSLLREKYKNHEMELQHAKNELEEMHRTSEKLSKLNITESDETAQTQSQYSHLYVRIDMLGQDLKYSQEARDRLAKEVLHLEKDFNLEREARAKLESTLHDVIQERQHDILILDENWKSLHENEVARLKRTIDDLNQKLNREEEIRRCVQIGMDSLQRHFTSTSTPSDGRPTPSFTKFNGVGE